ncbi:phage protein [Streptococcus pyogenes]|nr:hypothetical phage protein [Streptococcus pyogenes MGAS8232]AIL11189.1 hypothetical protein DP15_478 [Streptococcus pyogenes]ESU90581.1 hypothetical protein HMPREF1243_0565 [Streptococcus pyogenes GA03747]QBX19241.1 hypothetical protein Javan477_0015 [Streptococcus phage Javan477]QBX20428.1 hypothetical protein Javan521_0016 [Streptococcus phage Javan521]
MDARTGGNMTVKELIAKLQEFPDFMNVKISLIDVERTDISEITISAIGC